MASRSPTYFELFPTAHGAAHAALILPARSAKPGVPLRAEWDFIVTQTPYADAIARGGPVTPETYFGIIPVGRPRRTTLDTRQRDQLDRIEADGANMDRLGDRERHYLHRHGAEQSQYLDQELKS